jgi:hypothetical protein
VLGSRSAERAEVVARDLAGATAGNVRAADNATAARAGHIIVDEFFPRRYRHAYDEQFHRKLMSTVAKVSYDLANPYPTHSRALSRSLARGSGNSGRSRRQQPACTAEELVIHAIIGYTEMLLDESGLGQPWTDLREDLLEDLDFETLFWSDMDGVENDPLAVKTVGLDVHPLSDWFTPFNDSRIVHPYAATRESRPALFDLTDRSRDVAGRLAAAYLSGVAPARVSGMEPVSELVGAARSAVNDGERDLWVPDSAEPARFFASATAQAGTSGWLTFQPYPDAEVSEEQVLSFAAHPAHPATGDAWAEVMFFNGRLELPLSAVVSFRPDPGVRQRWNKVFEMPPG